MRPPRRPAERRRGTRSTSRGRKRGGRGLTIPWPYHEHRPPHLQLGAGTVSFERGGYRFLVEPTRRGHLYAPTPDDVLRVLGACPAEATSGVIALVFRQPTRKQEILAPVWGRIYYQAAVGSGGKALMGPVIILEAQPSPQGQVRRWSRSLSLESQARLEELREDGHRIEAGRRHWLIRSDLEALRRTQLYRTLPHELGHLVHRRRALLDESDPEIPRELRERRFFARAPREHERFADGYAAEVLAEARQRGRLPFPRIERFTLLASLGVQRSWFAAKP